MSSEPALQLEASLQIWPGLHVGWQLDAGDKLLKQLPTASFTGATDALHGLGARVALGNAPALQLEALPTM